MSTIEEEPTTPCIACGHPIPASADKCPKCESSQKLKLCVVCHKAMPADADYCNECKSYQGFRRHLTISSTVPALLGVMLAVITTGAVPFISYLNERNSDTDIKVIGANRSHVIVKVRNKGRKPSTLLGYRLIFDKMPRKEIMLDLDADDVQQARNVVAGDSSQTINLTNRKSEFPADRVSKQYNEDDLADLLKKSLGEVPLTLEVDVEESDDPAAGLLCRKAREFHQRRDRFNAERIANFIPAFKP